MKDALEKSRINEDADLAPKVFGFAALGVMAATFALMGFPMTVIIFLVLVGYFVWRAVSKTEMNEIRSVFEFYLAANEILRDDERRWYGFEVREVIERGERIVHFMPDAPPLVRFTLGALHNYVGNHDRAAEHLSFIVESEHADEKNLLSASGELKNYVRILRKLEREPSEAPQTMGAIRALERSRRNRAAALLEESRRKLKEIAAKQPRELPSQQPRVVEPVKPLLERLAEVVPENPNQPPLAAFKSPITDVERPAAAPTQTNGNQNLNGKTAPPAAEEKKEAANQQPQKPRQGGGKTREAHRPISEVLRDIYD